MSGTSMACPHIAGLAALALGENGGMTPATLKSTMKSQATQNAISSPGSGSPNQLGLVQPWLCSA
eukprot:NODE_1475_length_536_cov_141.480493_g1398_i0.p1 GENE.NODE_1475_length_536_cov_141.480493_g1398_i0~~NODE_1475_length_536_cov_141.480493_g1398_i0.p1  ORF type:complete len:65 (+),score=9.79 NODE_1475_length_536_cov_141.480493_g1398_i0:162-356(+)